MLRSAMSACRWGAGLPRTTRADNRPSPRNFVDQLFEAADLAHQRILDAFDPHRPIRDQRCAEVQACIGEGVSDVAPAPRWWLSRNPVSHSMTSSTSAWVRPFCLRHVARVNRGETGFSSPFCG